MYIIECREFSKQDQKFIIKYKVILDHPFKGRFKRFRKSGLMKSEIMRYAKIDESKLDWEFNR